MTANIRRIGPHSRPSVLAKLDQRTRAARLLRETRAELIEHLGGRPSVVQVRLIERAAWLSLRLAQLDQRIAEGGFTEHDSGVYLAWSNSLARLLARLGLQPAAAAPPSLADHLARRAAEREAREKGAAAC